MEKMYWHNMCVSFIFSVYLKYFCWTTYLVSQAADECKMHVSSCKVSVIIEQFSQNWTCLTMFCKIITYLINMEIHSTILELLHAYN